MWFILGLVAQAAPPNTVFFPSGSFERGSGEVPDETPKHTVFLDAYYLERTEVSIADFERFVEVGWQNDANWSVEGLSWKKQNPNGAGAKHRSANRTENHPVVAVTWYEADAYCRWKGGSLPTEAQWERAACASQKPGRFAWGNDEMVDAVWYSAGKYGHLQSVLTNAVDDAPAAQLTADGLYHTTGNVWEWTADWYDANYYQKEESKNPKGNDTGTWKTLRGGSFMNLPSYCTCTHREPAQPDRVAYTTGFRCAYDGGAQ